MRYCFLVLLALTVITACKKSGTDNTNPTNTTPQQNTNPVVKPCPDGYTGVGCTTSWADRMVGSWDATYSAGGQHTSTTMEVKILSQPKHAVVSNFFVNGNQLNADFSSANDFTLSGNSNYTGSGKLSDDGKEIHGTFTAYGGALTLDAYKK